jgi:hypothetical protein
MKIATTKERILQFIEYKQISKQKFFSQTGLKRGILDADKLKTSIPDTFVTTIIATYPDLDLTWLLTGKGKMLRQPPSPTGEEVSVPIKPDDSYREKYYKLMEEHVALHAKYAALMEEQQRGKKGYALDLGGAAVKTGG